MGDCNVIALGRGIGFKATFLGVHFRVLLLWFFCWYRKVLPINVKICAHAENG
jgi:hypothetical protein